MLPPRLLELACRDWRQRKRAASRQRELAALEDWLADAYSNSDVGSPVFILASPRTGSTFLYQMVCKYLNVSYFSNAATPMSNMPFLAFLLSRTLINLEQSSIECVNEYGVSKGISGPSEATLIFNNWFKHEHPSEIRSSDFTSYSHMQKMQRVFSAINAISSAPLVTKNAWNCFRIKALRGAFPEARFIHLKRDIVQSSYSTLQARKKAGDPNIIWNSASPSNYDEIRRLPYFAQVVEQQIQTNEAVRQGLSKAKYACVLEYNELLVNPEKTLRSLAEFMSVEFSKETCDVELNVKPVCVNREDNDWALISDYCELKGYIEK